jgi:poly(beta-D-mannuronate) lyase
MIIKVLRLPFIVSLFCCVLSLSAQTPGKLIKNAADLGLALKEAKAGDTLVLAKGTYTDLAILWTASGSAEKPVTLKAEVNGQVFLEGRSYLRLGGDHQVVEGLVFRNGFTPEGGVIEFMVDAEHIANNSRVTQCAIDHFNPSDRFRSDNWVIFQGRKNRLDHCYLGGKLNGGPALIVELDLPGHRQNFHSIDHNVFGYRPRLGSNGGETIRIGVSTFCQYSSNTLIENNYFERCAGEVETVSVKSSDNVVRGNVFEECEGVVALRHGDRNLVEGNFFLGNGKPYTGGVRVINESQIIRNNHFQELTGPRFFGPLAVMNGVPNSLPNRYIPVKNALIEGNRFFNCRSMGLGEGADNERSVPPSACRIEGNLFFNQEEMPPYVAVADISGFSFKNNQALIAGKPFAAPGFTAASSDYVKIDGLYQSASYKPVLPVLRKDCGPSAYVPTPDYRSRQAVGIVQSVAPGLDSLLKAVAKSSPGDILELQPGADYPLSKTLVLKHSLSLRSAQPAKAKALVHVINNSKDQPIIRIMNGASLSAKGIHFEGLSDNGVSKAAIMTDNKPFIDHFSVLVEDCNFTNFDAGGCNAFTMAKSTYADSVTFRDCYFQNISGIALSLRSEAEDKGIYNAEFVTLENCVFNNVMGSCLDLYRGGNDESTGGPFLKVDHCTFYNCNNVELGSVLRLTGVQVSDVRNCLFFESGMSGRAIRMEDHRSSQMLVSYCNLDRSGRIESFYDRKGPGITELPSEFVDPAKGDFRLKPGSALCGKASDGKDLGALRN